MLKSRFLLLFVLLGLQVIAHAAPLPKTFSNEYTATAFGFDITVRHELKQNSDGTFDMHFHAESWFASIDEVSHLLINTEKEQVIPLHYTYKRRVMGRDRDADLTFNWADKTVTNNVQNTSWKMGIADQVQDKLSYQLQLQLDLINGKKNLVYQIADGGHLKEYGFEIVDEEMLKTPLGTVKTVKVKRSRKNDKRLTYAWLAKDFNYLLVRLQQEEDGDAYTIDLSKANIEGKPIKSFE